MKYPWFKFYPQDWRGDAKLQMCSLAARGLWIEMCCIMHEASPYGHLVINGQPVTDAQLVRLTGTSVDQLSEILGELENAGVFSRNNKGVIYSRRMTRSEKKAQVNRKNGQKGGASKHKKTKDDSGLGKQNPSEPPRPRSQILDTRYSVDKSTAADAGDDLEKTEYEKLTKTVWKSCLPWLVKNSQIDEKRCRGVIGKWLREYSAARVITAVTAAQMAGVDEPISWITEWCRSREHLADGHEDEGGLDGWERRVRRSIAKTRGDERADEVYSAYKQREEWAVSEFVRIGNELKERNAA